MDRTIKTESRGSREGGGEWVDRTIESRVEGRKEEGGGGRGRETVGGPDNKDGRKQ